MMDNSKRRKSLSVLYSLSVLALLTLFLLPATRWLAVSQIAANFAPFGNHTNGWLRHTMGVKEDRQRDAEAVNARILDVAGSNPSDYGLQYAAILMTPQPIDAATVIPTMEYQLQQLFNLGETFRYSPRANADFLRQASRTISVGRGERQGLASEYTTTTTTASPVLTPERTALLLQMLESANAGANSEPSNAFFPLMKSVVFFAMENDQSALSELHAAALCSHYDDHAIEEAIDLSRMASQAFGKQSVITEVTQGASVLLPHYAQLRGAMRLAVVSAIEKEASGDKKAGLTIRHNIFKAGYLMRSQARLLVGNLVGSAIEGLAGTRPGGIPQIASSQGGKKSDERDPARISRFASYLNTQGRSDLAQFVRREADAKVQLKTIAEKGSPLSAFGGTETFLLGMWHTLGTIWVANILYLILFGTAATILLKRKMKSLRPALLILACWFAIAVFYSWYNAPNQTAYASAVSILYNLSDNADSSNAIRDSAAVMRFASLLSVAVPLGIAAVVCLVSAFSRVPLSLGLLRGLRGLCLPAAALLVLLWVPVMVITMSKENALRMDYQGFLHHEGKHLAKLAQTTFPEEDN